LALLSSPRCQLSKGASTVITSPLTKMVFLYVTSTGISALGSSFT
jgi:hypothetical protein